MVGLDFSPLIKARAVLDSVWQQALLKGRTWGPKRNDNPFAASNITIAKKVKKRIELVSVSQNQDGSLSIHEFSAAEKTELGLEVRKLLEEAGLNVKNTQIVP